MKVIICGGGQVGSNIARYLASEDADVTVIDQRPDLVHKITDVLDVGGVVGFASHPEVLEKAGARDADMIIAVTYADEVNMVACQVCHSLFDVPTKIARVRHRSYLEDQWSTLFSRDHLPIDVIISPEAEVAKAISYRLQVPSAFEVIPLADGRLTLAVVHVKNDTPIILTPLRQLTEIFPDLNLTIVGIRRNGEVVMASGEEELRPGDDAYFISDIAHLERGLSSFGYDEREARRVIIIGGGNIGLHLAQTIEEQYGGVQAKVIELDKRRAEAVAQQLARTVVIHGDALDTDIMEECNVAQTETVVAVSNDDEVNILSSLLAKRHGAKRAVTLVNSTSYDDLVSGLGIDTMVSPRAITVSTILRHVRRGRIRSVHSISHGVGEVIEAEALETSSLVAKPLREADLPEGIMIGAILRGQQVIMPRGDTVISAGDLVVLYATSRAAKRVERLFSVKLEFF